MVAITDGSPRARLTLAFDLIAIVAFIGVGMTSHHDDPAPSIFLRNFIPFTTAWLFAASAFGTYRPVSNRTLVRTLLVAIPAGVVLRVLWVRAWDLRDVVTFAAVALVFASVFIGAGRVVSGALGSWSSGRSARRPQ